MRRRWNGWGEEANEYPLTENAKMLLRQLFGAPTPLPDASLADVIAKVPASLLPVHTFIDVSTETRIRHARGQSLPDWLALREGNLSYFPDGVAFPKSSAEVRELIDWAENNDVLIIPYGGGTSVVGHITLAKQPTKPVLVISLAKLNQLLALDPVSQLARFGAGVTGLQLEQLLKPRGFRLGHYPQSFEYSTLGGWIATRSCGQQSLGYGRIEQLFAGGKIETLTTTWDLPTYPASSAGPDLREWFMGSEGRLGILTEAVVRISPLPDVERFEGWVFPDWQSGLDAVRNLAQARVPLSMLRLANVDETRINLMLAEHATAVAWLKRYLLLRGICETMCLLIVAYSGSKTQVSTSRRQAAKIIRANQGVTIGQSIGVKWQANRFRAPYLRESLWRLGVAVDTLETAADWNELPALVSAVEQSLTSTLTGIPVLAFTHLSHCYRQGSSAYTTYLYPVAATYAETYDRWKQLKTAASKQIIAHHGTISHQHGVGRDHKIWLAQEKGRVGTQLIESVLQQMDPQGRLNQGALMD